MFVLVFWVIPDAVVVVSQAECASWENRFEKLDRVSLREIGEVAAGVETVELGFVPGSLRGLALPGAVVFTAEPLPYLWVHEMAHQVQMRRDGVVGFAVRYATDWYRGRLHGCGFFDSYEAISYELEAEETARQLSRRLKSVWREQGRELFVEALSEEQDGVWLEALMAMFRERLREERG